MQLVAEAWWKLWDREWVTNLIPKPKKWRSTKSGAQVGDVVVFRRTGDKPAVGEPPWRVGLVTDKIIDADGLNRDVTLAYRNAKETFNRHTNRSVRTLGVIKPEAEVDVFAQVNEAARQAAVHMYVREIEMAEREKDI
jgi:hypothetical protein